jgi:hypothetical protein
MPGTHGQGLRDTPDGAAGVTVVAENQQVNPLCGDEVTVRLVLRRRERARR